MTSLHTENLSVGYEERLIVDRLSITIPEGKITALVGANGCGKSTILKTLARILKPSSGGVYLNGKWIEKQCTKQIAKQLSILPQGPEAPEGLTVSELVAYGRFPHQKRFGSLTHEDKRMIEWAISVTGLSPLADRSVCNLSGGQRQRAWIAMALAQGTELLLLDEPTTYLDMAHQLEVLKLLRTLNDEAGRTVVMVIHDLNHAARFAHHIIAIANGKVVMEGPPAHVVTPDVLLSVFGIEAEVIADPRTGNPLCIPYELSTM